MPPEPQTWHYGLVAPVVGRVQRGRPRDRLLPDLHRAGRGARAGRGVRDGTPAPALPAGGPRRRRLRRLGGHDRALPGAGRARGAVADALRAGDARARSPAEVQDDLRLRRLRSGKRSCTRCRRRRPVLRAPRAGWDLGTRQRGPVCGRGAVVAMDQGGAGRAAPGLGLEHRPPARFRRNRPRPSVEGARARSARATRDNRDLRAAVGRRRAGGRRGAHVEHGSRTSSTSCSRCSSAQDSSTSSSTAITKSRKRRRTASSWSLPRRNRPR